MKMKLILYVYALCIAVVVGVLTPQLLAAPAYSEDVIGSRGYRQKVIFFENFNVGGTFGTTTGYVYESPNKTGINDGWHPVRNSKRISVQIGVDILTLGTRTARIEGRTGKDSRPCEILSLDYNAPTVIDEIIDIGEGITDIRVGWNCTSATNDSVYTYALVEMDE